MAVDTLRRVVRLVRLALVVLLAACVTVPGVHATRHVLVDTDMGWDDVIALLTLWGSPGVAVVGVTTVNGIAHVDAGSSNVLRMLQRAQLDIPVAVGADGPIKGDRAFPSKYRTISDELAGLTLPPLSRQPVPQSAAQFLVDMSHAYTDLDLICLGPLTNVALALQLDPTLLMRVRSATLMGGAVYSPGNVNVTGIRAEWNFYLDSQALSDVFARTSGTEPRSESCGAPIDTAPHSTVSSSGASSVPSTLLGLDVTAYSPVPEIYDALHNVSAGNEVGRMLLESLTAVHDVQYQIIYDPVASAAYVRPALISFTSVELYVNASTGEVDPVAVARTRPSCRPAPTPTPTPTEQAFEPPLWPVSAGLTMDTLAYIDWLREIIVDGSPATGQAAARKRWT